MNANPLDIPTFTPFTIPRGSTIAQARVDFSMIGICNDYLTDENFGTELPKGPVAGSFLVQGDLSSFEAVETIEMLADLTRRKFRPGNPIEALLFGRQHSSLCKRRGWVALGKVWRGRTLRWEYEYKKLYLGDWAGQCFGAGQVFIVEDLQPSTTLY